MKILTPEEMRKCDAYTTEKEGIDENTLMERAGHAVVRTIVEEFRTGGKNMLILCGNGNNGGDGLVMARELSDLGYHVNVLMVLGISKLSMGNRKNLELLSHYPVKIAVCNETNLKESGICFSDKPYDIIVDSIFGTGLYKKIPKYIDEFLETINKSPAIKIAVDVPTGINCENGQLLAENPFQADLTVSFAFPKTGSLVFPAREHVGKLRIAYIGIKNDTPEKIGWEPKFLMNEKTAGKLIPKRNSSGHKGTFGKVVVIGGSGQYRGAPVLSAKAAFTTGCGMVNLVSASKEMEPYSFPELIRHEVINYANDGEYLSYCNFDEISEIIAGKDVMILGPGLGRQYSTSMLVMNLLENTDIPVVLDADGLYALSETSVKIPESRMANMVLTPHIKEFSRLCKIPIDIIERNYIQIGKEFAVKTGCTLVLKSSTTVIFTSQGEAILNVSGNSGLAKAGSGDVLAGIIGGFIAQGCSTLRSAQLGVFMAGLSAEIYADENPEHTFTPSKVIEYLPKAFKHICEIN